MGTGVVIIWHMGDTDPRLARAYAADLYCAGLSDRQVHRVMSLPLAGCGSGPSLHRIALAGGAVAYALRLARESHAAG